MENYVTYLENEDVKVSHHPEHNILLVQSMSETPMMEGVQEGWAKALELAVEHQILNWINDESKVELHDQEVIDWWRNVWFKNAMQHLQFRGKRHIAMIVSPRFYADFAAKQSLDFMKKQQGEKYIVGEQSKYMETRVFKEHSEAEQWILSLNEMG